MNMDIKKKFVAVAVCFVLAAFCLTACTGTEAKSEVSIDSMYREAVEDGTFQGTKEEFLDYIRGESAYELAVRKGFIGTEEEWLASLRGDNGMDGEDGAITAYGIYEEAVADGYTGTFLDFVSAYLGAGQTKDYVSQDSLLSTVSIYCHFTEKVTLKQSDFGFWFGGGKQVTQDATSAGSGVIYKLRKETGDAYIITNYHVVYDEQSVSGVSENILVYLYGGEILGKELYTEYNSITQPDYEGTYIAAEYVGGSQNYDIAVLKVTGSERLKNSAACAIHFADSNKVVPGQTAYAIGNPEGGGISVTKGVVSVDSESLDDGSRVIRIDTAVNSGNSGGGLFDNDGSLIGIVNAKSIASDVENIAYALPSNVVRYVVENIMDYQNAENKTGDVRKCMLGITITARESSARLDDDGVARIREKVTIAGVEETGLANGKLQEGDEILSVSIKRAGKDGTEEYAVNRTFIIVDLMLTMRVGDTLTMRYVRSGEAGEAEFVMTEECISEIG